MKIYVQHKQYCTNSTQSDESYSEWSASYDSEITGASLSPKYGDEEFEVSFECTPGIPVFVLSMTYTTGDSFGSSSGNLEILWVFKDPETALNAKQVWETACYNHDNSLTYDDYSVQFQDEQQNIITLSNPAIGYFEKIENINLSIFLLNI